MGAKLKPGWLYFLGEEDYVSGARSPYVKIGKTDHDKPVSARIKEHATGNPRRVVEVAPAVRTQFIDPLETHMHHRFSLNRVHGEWFSLTAAELRQAESEARRVNGEMSALAGKAKRVRSAAKKVSNGIVKKATAAAKRLHAAFVVALTQRSLLDLQQSMVETELRRLNGSRDGIAGIAVQIMTSPGPKFDMAAFEAARPAMVRRFTKTKTAFSTSFKMTDKPSAAKTHTTLNENVKAARGKLSAVTSVTGGEKGRSPASGRLHAEWLRLHAETAALDWEVNRFQVEIKSLCGTSEGIDGVCSWKRENKTSSSFDTAAFKKAHPKIWQSFTVPGVPQVRFTVLDHTPY